jgi:hypothetical protein
LGISSSIIINVFLIYYTHTLHHHLFSGLSQSNHILELARTRNNNADNNNAKNPPPLNLEQVLMMQDQMLQTMQQTMVNMQQNK